MNTLNITKFDQANCHSQWGRPAVWVSELLHTQATTGTWFSVIFVFILGFWWKKKHFRLIKPLKMSVITWAEKAKVGYPSDPDPGLLTNSLLCNLCSFKRLWLWFVIIIYIICVDVVIFFEELFIKISFKFALISYNMEIKGQAIVKMLSSKLKWPSSIICPNRLYCLELDVTYIENEIFSW